jgi:hypothetical protein
MKELINYLIANIASDLIRAVGLIIAFGGLIVVGTVYIITRPFVGQKVAKPFGERTRKIYRRWAAPIVVAGFLCVVLPSFLYSACLAFGLCPKNGTMWT